MIHSIPEVIKRAQAAYNTTAVQYDAATEVFFKSIVYPKLLLLLEKYYGVITNKKFLDVGCGSGRFIEMLLERGAACCGIDVAHTFVDIACARGLDVSQASMHDLPFLSETFDCVVSNYALNYLPKEGQFLALKEQYRVLCHGGVMVFSYMHPFLMRIGQHNYFKPKRQSVVEMFGQEFILYLFDWPEIYEMLTVSNFSSIRLIDSEIPDNLNDIINKSNNEAIVEHLKQFALIPYAMFVVAQKV